MKFYRRGSRRSGRIHRGHAEGLPAVDIKLTYIKALGPSINRDARGHTKRGKTVGESLYGGGIRDDHIICLECGKALQLLSNRHLALHGLTASSYRQKWSISPHTPLTSYRLAQRRYQLAHSLEQCEQTIPSDDDEMEDFFHELAEVLTILQGQVHLAQKSLSSYTLSPEYLEAMQHTVMRIGQRMSGGLLTS